MVPVRTTHISFIGNCVKVVPFHSCFVYQISPGDVWLAWHSLLQLCSGIWYCMRGRWPFTLLSSLAVLWLSAITVFLYGKWSEGSLPLERWQAAWFCLKYVPVGICSSLSYSCVPVWWASLASPVPSFFIHLSVFIRVIWTVTCSRYWAFSCLAVEVWIETFTLYTQFLGKWLCQEDFVCGGGRSGIEIIRKQLEWYFLVKARVKRDLSSGWEAFFWLLSKKSW